MYNKPGKPTPKPAPKIAAKKAAVAKARSKDMTTGKKPFYGFDGNPMGYKGPTE
jgi:hypothetical protein